MQRKETKMADLSSFKNVRAMMSEVLNVLWYADDKTVKQDKGKATALLVDSLPSDALARATTTRNLQFGVIGKLKEAGMVKSDVRGKRTYSYKLVAIPFDWSPESVAPVAKKPEDSEPMAPDLAIIAEDDARQQAESDAVVAGVLETLVPAETADEATELGMRPGRLAARIEKTIPTLVEEGVVAGLGRFLAAVATTMGHSNDPAFAAKVEALEDQVDALRHVQGELELAQSQLRIERQQYESAREELNRMIRRTEVVTDTLRPADVPEMFRGLARNAIAAGFTIQKTNGDHLRWTNPTGQSTFTGSTPSSPRSLQNAKADLERLGLPK